MSALGMPRILILEEGAALPVLEPLEECVRSPVEHDDILRRVDSLEKCSRSTVPKLEPSGLLHFGGQRIALSPFNADIMRVLIDHYPLLVPRSHLARSVWVTSKPTRNAVDLQILRLRRRISSVGLHLKTVTGKGYVLHLSEGEDADAAV